MTREITGGCQCGGVRYALSAPPDTVYCCHCLECRRQSASAFGVSAIFPAAALRVTKGAPKAWTRPTDSGGTLTCWFCPDCGSRLWHGDGDGVVSVKGGSLDDPPDLSGARHIWTRSRWPGVAIPPEAETFEKEPS